MIRAHSTSGCSESLSRGLLLGAVLAALGADAAAQVRVYRPATPSAVVLRLGGAAGGAHLAQVRAAAREAPDDRAAQLRYVDALMAAGAETGIERYYGYAERLLAEARMPDDPPLALRRAQLLQHRHEFRAAADLLARVLERERRNSQARLMRAQILLHLNEPERAAQDCAALAPLVDVLTTATCMAQVRAALGDLDRAYGLVTAALEAQRGADARRSWSAGVAAELAARRGDAAAAGRWHAWAFELDRNHFTRLSYADWLLAQGRFDTALAVAAGGASLAERARVALAARDPDSPQARALQLAWREARARGERAHLHEQARFALSVRGDLPQAHRLAAESFRARAQPQDALLLAQTARARRDRAALREIELWKRRHRYRDARLDRLLQSPP